MPCLHTYTLMNTKLLLKSKVSQNTVQDDLNNGK